ncbi:MAG: hypothetical protein KAQ99_03240 [Candidatus Aureabacteria bacterium]|nr:hypothetical protein [Candidatus Auribacterota bacterium]
MYKWVKVRHVILREKGKNTEGGQNGFPGEGILKVLSLQGKSRITVVRFQV